MSTIIRSASSRPSSTSLVISSTVLRSCRQMRSSSSCSVARVSASRAPSGSSSSRISGFMASARATATRCRMPPESSRGRLSRAAARLTSATYCSAHLRRFVLRPVGVNLVDRQLHVLQHAQPRQQRVVLEHDAALRSGTAHLADRRRGSMPASGASRPATSEISVVLPEPERPTMATNSPRATRRLTSDEHLGASLGRTVAFGHAAQFKIGIGRRSMLFSRLRRRRSMRDIASAVTPF